MAQAAVPRSFDEKQAAEFDGWAANDEVPQVTDEPVREAWVRSAFGGLRSKDEAEDWRPAY